MSGVESVPANPVALFAALGDSTRLSLIARLGDGASQSIARIGGGLPMSRQAVAKHLDILHQAGLIDRCKSGREVHVALRREAIEEARRWLDQIDAQWDDTLSRLKTLVEQA
jgi:DNA-binding transcriptional ArsR family regulator